MTLKSMIELADGLTPIETEIGYYVLRNQEDILDSQLWNWQEKAVWNVHMVFISKDLQH